MGTKLRSILIYVGVSVLFTASYLLGSKVPTGNVLGSLAGNAGVVALIGGLFQMFRDNTAHERRTVSSRRANVPFRRTTSIECFGLSVGRAGFSSVSSNRCTTCLTSICLSLPASKCAARLS